MSTKREPTAGASGVLTRRQMVRPALKESLRDLRDFVEETCRSQGVPEREAAQLKLAVDEVCTNLVAYGYEGRPPGDIRVSVEVGADEVRVTVRDWGAPFHPDEAPAPDLSSDWRERRVGGLGWHLVRQVTDRIDYTADSKSGNELLLVKRFQRS